MKKIIKERHLRMQCEHLKDKYNLTFTGIADYLDVNETILRRFLAHRTGSLSNKNYQAICKIPQLAIDLEKTE